jgi:predicted kinase
MKEIIKLIEPLLSMLIIVCGLPGSGKSSFSDKLSKHYSAVHINSDVIRKRLFAKPDYSEEEKESVYTQMAAEAGDLLKEGRSVVLDATFFRKEYRDMMRKIGKKAGTEIFVIRCVLGEEETKKRLSERKTDVSDADYEIYLKLRKTFEPISGAHLRVNTSEPLEKQLRVAKEFVGAKL